MSTVHMLVSCEVNDEELVSLNAKAKKQGVQERDAAFRIECLVGDSLNHVKLIDSYVITHVIPNEDGVVIVPKKSD